jgi:fatty-acid desaturase
MMLLLLSLLLLLLLLLSLLLLLLLLSLLLLLLLSLLLLLLQRRQQRWLSESKLQRISKRCFYCMQPARCWLQSHLRNGHGHNCHFTAMQPACSKLRCCAVKQCFGSTLRNGHAQSCKGEQ